MLFVEQVSLYLFIVNTRITGYSNPLDTSIYPKQAGSLFLSLLQYEKHKKC